MDSLSALGCFAYYFNSIFPGVYTLPVLLAKAPLYTLYLVAAALLSILASKLLVSTIDLHFSESLVLEGREQLLMRPPSQRHSSLNLPSLFERCVPHTCSGTVLYVAFLAAVLVMLLRSAMCVSLNLYVYVKNGETMGWGGLMLLFLVGTMVAASMSYQSMEGVQIACMLLNIMDSVRSSILVIGKQIPMNTFDESSAQLFPLFVSLLSNQVVIPCVLAAAGLTSHCQFMLQAWAASLVVGLSLVIAAFLALCGPEFSPMVLATAERIGPILTVSSAFSFFHIWVRALAAVVIAWRYGTNLQTARRRYPQRVKTVEIVLPLLVSLPYLVLIACYGLLAVVNWISKSKGNLVSASAIWLIIPYCYCSSVRSIGEALVKDRVSRWWCYLLYLGGTVALIGSLINGDLIESVGVDVALVAGMLLWQVIGHFIP